MPASTKHKLYERNIERWQLVRDAVEGEDAIKTRSPGDAGADNNSSLSGTTYLPQPNPEDQDYENLLRYTAYKTRASFVNFTGSTKEGLLGMVFRKPPEIELPVGVDYMMENADGAGKSLIGFLSDGIADSMETGRYGILVDYPPAPEGLTQAQVTALGLQANLLSYPAESVVNWKTEVVGSMRRLNMVVLREPTEINIDQFETETVNYHRVLMLVEGVYTQFLFNEDDEQIPIGEELFFQPRKFDGSLWNEIPFQFIGSQNNDSTPDKSILLDIARVNISHYRNSADYEESSFMVGQPTPALAGLSQGWVDSVMKGGVMLGSRRAILLPEGGSASLLQANDNQMPSKGMERKEEQMVMLGARIIQDASGVETAEAAKIRFSGQNSKLAMLVMNWEEAIEKVIEWAMEFMGASGEVTVDLNKQFYDASLDAQSVIAQIQLLDRGVIASSDLRSKLRRTGWIEHDRTDEDIETETGSGNPL